MEQFIRYLYEYQQGQPSRNVGFVKTERGEEQTTVHIHGKGLRLGKETQLRLYIFFMEKGAPVGVYQGTVTNINPALNYRLTFTKEDTGRPERYPQIQGIIMRSEGKRCFASVWNDMPVPVEKMEEWQEPEVIPLTMTEAVRKAAVAGVATEGQKALSGEKKDALGAEPVSGGESAAPGRALADSADARGRASADAGGAPRKASADAGYVQRRASADAGYAQRRASADGVDAQKRAMADAGYVPGRVSADSADARGRASADNKRAAEKAEGGKEGVSEAEADGYITPLRRLCKKISRQDIAMLPRCEWRLANNSFLLHGCYNYHHLMLVEEGDELWLGVPGIYHSREAKAAEAFGFPRFVHMGEIDAQLEPDEAEPEEKFGYWCRKVKRMNHFHL